MRRVPGDKVGFARIDEFKGLENEAAHYVAMSRARSVLSLIYRGASNHHAGMAVEDAPS